MATKKVGVAGKFGSRYGKTIRDRYSAAMKVQKAEYACPSCAKPTLAREATGIWRCPVCNLKVAGKAYRPQ